MKWSLSAYRTFRRCQRQYFFKHIAANHAAKKDPLRREAFLLSQLKSLATWQGLVIHQGIKEFLVPCLEQHHPVRWEEIAEQTVELAQQQFAFSRAHRFRTPQMTKGSCNGEYCALFEHEQGGEISAPQLEEVFETIRRCFSNLARMDDLLSHIQGKPFYQAETAISAKYEGTTIQVVPDLLFSRAYGYFTIVDWKVEQDHTTGDHHLQTALYAWAMWQSANWHIGRPENVELIEVQLLQGRMHRHSCSAVYFEDLENTMYRSIHEISSLAGNHKYQDQVLADYEFAPNPNSCPYCSFNTLCRELAHDNPLPESF